MEFGNANLGNITGYGAESSNILALVGKADLYLFL